MTMRGKLVAGIAALLLLGGSVALGIWLFRDGVTGRVERDADRAVADADAVDAKLVRQDQPIYYQIDPPLVVNLQDNGGIIQVGISFSTHYAAVADAMKSDDPALRSAIIFALADVRPDAADTDDGKRALLSTVVAAANRQLQQDGYEPRVDGAYFTSFLVQQNDDD